MQNSKQMLKNGSLIDQKIYHLLHQFIVCIRLSTPCPLSKLSVNLPTVQAPPFLAIPLYILVFLQTPPPPPLKIGFFSEPP